MVFALAEGVATPTPRCTWKSAPMPCYRTNDGTLVTIPLPADEDAGTFTLTVDRPGGTDCEADHSRGSRLSGVSSIFLTD